jgi:hypothetical protein
MDATAKQAIDVTTLYLQKAELERQVAAAQQASAKEALKAAKDRALLEARNAAKAQAVSKAKQTIASGVGTPAETAREALFLKMGGAVAAVGVAVLAIKMLRKKKGG